MSEGDEVKLREFLKRVVEPPEIEWKRLCLEYGWALDTPVPGEANGRRTGVLLVALGRSRASGGA